MLIGIVLVAGIVFGVWKFWPGPNSTINPPTANNPGNYEDSPFGGMAGVFQSINNHLNGDYSYAQDMGVKWYRVVPFFYWEFIDQQANGHYNFKEFFEPNKGVRVNFDQEFTEIPVGIHTVANIATFVEYSALNGAVTFASFENNQQYKNFVKALVERYDGDDDFGCVVSAPDCYFAGDGQYPSQQTIDAMKQNPIKYWQVGNVVGTNNNFATFQKVTYQAVKSADSGAKVLIGGDGGDYATVLSQLHGQYFDIFDFHWYGTANGDYLFPGSAYDHHNGGPSTFSTDVLAYYRNLLNSNGYSNVPIWITEQSAYSGAVTPYFRPIPAQTEQEQAGDYMRRYVYPIANRVSKVFFAYGLMEGISDAQVNDYYDNTGFLYDSRCDLDCKNIWPNGQEPARGTKKLSYYSFKLMTEKLEGSDWSNVRTIIDGANNVYAFQFTNKTTGRKVYVAWYDYWNSPSQTTKEVTIPVGLNGKVKITEAIPKYELGRDVTSYATAFNTGVVNVANGAVAIRLGQSPVYVEETSDSLTEYFPP